MAEPDHAAFVELLEEKGLNACPACDNPDWLIGDDPVFVPFVDPDSPFPGFRAVILFCSNCGLMHLHNYAALMSDDEVADDSAADDEHSDDAK
jgi:hypothetical protein